MTEVENGGGTVRFNVKDLLADINTKLDKFLEKLEAKASEADLDKVSERVQALEEEARTSRALANLRETTNLEREKTKERGLTRFQTYVVIVSSLASTAAIAVTAFSYFHL